MKRQHRMPFGAELLDDGRVRFRLWAPTAKTIELCLGDEQCDTPIVMVPEADGWWGTVTSMARPWALYRYRIDDKLDVPDPASRYQPDDVHGPSQVIDPNRFVWNDGEWSGRPWHEAVIYELHIGTFTAQGTFAAAAERLPYLAELGVTAIELMPVADFPGTRNWGYDGVLPFAPDSRYGAPDDLKAFVQRAHQLGLMVFLDVVYNHFGPDGNYLHTYAAPFFSTTHHTPWGAAINFDGTHNAVVREFFVENALYWLEEYNFDGLRLDAVHAIIDDSRPDIVEEVAARVRQRTDPRRHVHLILENDHNAAHYLTRNAPSEEGGYDAQWNDDIHHVLHVLLTGERDGYYADYIDGPSWTLGRCLAEGFAYQGEPSAYRSGTPRGERTVGLPPTAFVNFLQTHDQVGNRAQGERIHALTDAERLHAAVAVVLLAPSPPMLFMGEEFAAAQPFLYFCNFDGELAQAVTNGRRREFARFAKFADPAARESIPDPNDEATYRQSILNWECLAKEPHRSSLTMYKKLLHLRHQHIIPLLRHVVMSSEFAVSKHETLRVAWHFDHGATLQVLTNLTDHAVPIERELGRVIYADDQVRQEIAKARVLPPWSVIWSIDSQPGAVS